MSQSPVPVDPAARQGRRGPRGRLRGTLLTAVVAGGGALATGRAWSTSRMGDMRDRMGRGPWTDPTPAPVGPTANPTVNPPGVVATLLVLAAGLALAVWLAHRWPRATYAAGLALGALYLALGGPIAGAVVPAALVLARLMRRRPPGEWLGWAAAAIPALWAHAWTRPRLGLDDPDTYATVLFALAWLLVPALLLQAAGSRRAAAQAARDEELRRAAHEERLRVVRDIHDVVGHSLSMISLQSGVALHVFDSDPEQARASLTAIRDASRSSLAELRQTLGVFRAQGDAEPLAPTPTLAGVPALVESVRAGGRDVGLALPLDAAASVPAAVQAVAYRVVQEGLTNAVRHAPGAAIAVSVERAPGTLVVRVADSGPASAVPAEGNGLRGMRERVEALGGELRVGVRAGGGLELQARLPVAAVGGTA